MAIMARLDPEDIQQIATFKNDSYQRLSFPAEWPAHP